MFSALTYQRQSRFGFGIPLPCEALATRYFDVFALQGLPRCLELCQERPGWDHQSDPLMLSTLIGRRRLLFKIWRLRLQQNPPIILRRSFKAMLRKRCTSRLRILHGCRMAWNRWKTRLQLRKLPKTLNKMLFSPVQSLRSVLWQRLVVMHS